MFTVGQLLKKVSPYYARRRFVPCLQEPAPSPCCESNESIHTPSYVFQGYFNPLTPNDPYRGRTAQLTSKRCILYIYSTNIGTEYFKRSTYCPFFSLRNSVCCIILTYLVPVLFTFYIQGVVKLKKIIPAPKG